MQSRSKNSKLCPNQLYNCWLNPILSFPNSFDNQNSTKITNSSTLQYDFATSTTSSLYPHNNFTNPESLPSLQESFISFTRAFPQFLTTVEADQLRQNHYPFLSHSNHVCLDYVGHPMFSYHQENNEHVASSSSNLDISHNVKKTCEESEFEANIRGKIMRYLNVSEDDYMMFFTANQASGLGVLAECYPFESHKKIITVYDHENEAVDSMLERCKKRGARVLSAKFKWPKMKVHSKKLEEMIVGNKYNKKKKMREEGLLVFPLESRVCGTRYPYQWMNMARENGWHVLLDASGLAPKEMDTLGLSMFRPEFMICTFYKVFGHDPSGFACLFIKKSIVSMLNHTNISSSPSIVSLKSRYQNGSCSNGAIESDHDTIIEHLDVQCEGFDQADSLGLVLIGTRIRCLINWLVNALLALNHPHREIGTQLVSIYGPRVRFDRGHTIAFNIFDWKGEKIEPSLVQNLGDRNNISLGCAFLKHVWFSDRYEDDKKKLLLKGTREREEKGKGKKGEKSINYCRMSVVTASVSFLNNFDDVYKLWKFLSSFLDADFVEKERWRYVALNQRTVEV